jgi:uncharacterized membrane protein YedE/YeeE
MGNFTPVMSLLGGIIIGLSALLLLLSSGRVAGISGIFGGFLRMKPGETLWRFAFIAGLVAGGLLLLYLYPQALNFELTYSPAAIMCAGLLVGFGSRMGGGCTSGHGVCGIGRLSLRSIVAVVTFMATGVITAIVVGQIFAGRI